MASRTKALAAALLLAAAPAVMHQKADETVTGRIAAANVALLPLVQRPRVVAGTVPRSTDEAPTATPARPSPTEPGAARPTATAAPMVLSIAALQCSGRDELVLLANVGLIEGDLEGWSVVSVEGAQTYTFTSRILAPGATVALHSGPDAPPSVGPDIRWTSSYVWNNVGDRARLVSPAGTVVQEEDC